MDRWEDLAARLQKSRDEYPVDDTFNEIVGKALEYSSPPTQVGDLQVNAGTLFDFGDVGKLPSVGRLAFNASLPHKMKGALADLRDRGHSLEELVSAVNEVAPHTPSHKVLSQFQHVSEKSQDAFRKNYRAMRELESQNYIRKLQSQLDNMHPNSPEADALGEELFWRKHPDRHHYEDLNEFEFEWNDNIADGIANYFGKHGAEVEKRSIDNLWRNSRPSTKHLYHNVRRDLVKSWLKNR